jgi:hypothetical protein
MTDINVVDFEDEVRENDCLPLDAVPESYGNITSTSPDALRHRTFGAMYGDTYVTFEVQSVRVTDVRHRSELGGIE